MKPASYRDRPQWLHIVSHPREAEDSPHRSVLSVKMSYEPLKSQKRKAPSPEWKIRRFFPGLNIILSYQGRNRDTRNVPPQRFAATHSSVWLRMRETRPSRNSRKDLCQIGPIWGSTTAGVAILLRKGLHEWSIGARWHGKPQRRGNFANKKYKVKQWPQVLGRWDEGRLHIIQERIAQFRF